MEYEKEFKEIPVLVESLSERGLVIGDRDEAIRYLRRIGYFRSGGYRYVFRKFLPTDEQDVSSRSFRSDAYMAGSNLADIRSLEQFDERLRQVCLSGVLDFEIRLRAAIAHVLARRDVFAHTSLDHLNEHACAERARAKEGHTKFEAWRETYEAATTNSKEEDFVAHLIVKYGTPLPTWALLEVLSFGSIPFLFDLLKVDDQREVAAAFGVKQPGQFGAWTRSLVDLRNYCAHGSRLFNRQMKRGVKVIPSAIDQELLGHLANSDVDNQRRLYPASGVLAYLLRKHESGTNWHMTFKTQVRKLPDIRLDGESHALVSPHANMGFPVDWGSLSLWN